MTELPFNLTGTVTHGRSAGRTIDMPTANIVPAEDVSNLKYGVYYSVVKVDGASYKAITNLGKRPTIDDGDFVNAESFIYDFEGDLYGRDISVTLLEFRRPEQKFESFEALSRVMHEDLEAGREYSL
ncbi:MAG: riboflavin kinase [Lachnospiraceae bacterium]|nr:riboflavin kinase [Lachnospiraceae bacterium]MBR5761101.1 riboflavin kinase [Lachnospiraceae bacterium]